MLKIPEKIFNIDINDVWMGLARIHLYSKEEMEKAQEGYRYNKETGKPEYMWYGDEFYVIGTTFLNSMPIIAKVDEEQIPIYCKSQDNWSSIERIANSFEQFVSFLKKVKATDLMNKEECKRLTEEIENELSATPYYWSALIEYSYVALHKIYG